MSSAPSASPQKRRKLQASSPSPTKQQQQQPSLLSFFGGHPAALPTVSQRSTAPLQERPGLQHGDNLHRSEGPERRGSGTAQLRKSQEELEIERAIAASLQDDPTAKGGNDRTHHPANGVNGTSRQQQPASTICVSPARSLRGAEHGRSKGPSSGDKVSQCPICSKDIPFRTIEAHVNTCLDNSSARPSGFGPSIDEASEVCSAEQAALLRNGAADAPRSASCSPAPQSHSATPAPRALSPGNRILEGAACSDASQMYPLSKLTDQLGAETKVKHVPPPTSFSASAASVAETSAAPTWTVEPGSDAKGAKKPRGGSAFTMLMKSHSEAKQWATADAVEAANYRGRARTRPDARTAPFYKVLEGMPLSVDAFRFGRIEGCKGYFLTHFHSDHYGGLSSSWCHGPVYCSVTTANLCRSSLRVDDRWLRPLPMETPTLIPDSGGVSVTCLDANHCPGSCLFLFEGPQTAQLLSRSHASAHIGTGRVFRYLHCGDFRASPMHTNHPLVKDRKLDIIYLDTTYCNPRYCFPAQDQVVEACAELVRRCMPIKNEAGNDGTQKAEEGEEEQEDWRTPTRRGASAQAALVQSSAEAKAFKGWLGVAAPQGDETGAEVTRPNASEVRSTDDGSRIKTEQDESPALDDDDDEPLLEDEDSLIASGKVQKGMLSFEGEGREEPWHPAPAARDHGGGTSVIRIKEEPDAGAIVAPPDDCNGGVKKEEEPEGSASEEPTNARNWLAKQSHASKASLSLSRQTGRLLVVVGTYTIGKEKVVKAVARVLNTKVFCVDSRKYRVYSQLEDPELHALLTRDPNRADVHVTNLHAINADALRDMVAALRARGCGFTHAIAFRPTGWTYRPPSGMDTVSPNLDRLVEWNQNRNFGPQGLFPTRDSTPEYMIYGVPYSEHSSFFELTAFALSTRYDRIIATVNVGSPTSRAKMAKWFEKWAMEKRKRAKVGVLEGPAPRSSTYW